MSSMGWLVHCLRTVASLLPVNFQTVVPLSETTTSYRSVRGRSMHNVKIMRCSINEAHGLGCVCTFAERIDRAAGPASMRSNCNGPK